MNWWLMPAKKTHRAGRNQKRRKNNEPEDVGRYHRKTTISIEEGLAHVVAAQDTVTIDGVLVSAKSRSQRLPTFVRCGTTCVTCGLQASYFAVEMSKYQKAKRWHLNLYGVNAEGKEILFTHDHVLARSVGGADDQTNTQTMCDPCNAHKATYEPRKIVLTPPQVF